MVTRKVKKIGLCLSAYDVWMGMGSPGSFVEWWQEMCVGYAFKSGVHYMNDAEDWFVSLNACIVITGSRTGFFESVRLREEITKIQRKAVKDLLDIERGKVALLNAEVLKLRRKFVTEVDELSTNELWSRVASKARMEGVSVKQLYNRLSIATGIDINGSAKLDNLPIIAFIVKYKLGKELLNC